MKAVTPCSLAQPAALRHPVHTLSSHRDIRGMTTSRESPTHQKDVFGGLRSTVSYQSEQTVRVPP